MSQNNRKFLSIMKEGIQQDNEANNYSMPLPLKDDQIQLPNNRGAVSCRLTLLREKLSKEQDFKNQYLQFMNSMIQGEEAEVVLTSVDVSGRIWYIPHFWVSNLKKNKLCVVFDCSSKHQYTSLNNCVLRGSNHINSLIGILMVFRMNNITLTCDVEKNVLPV